MDSRVGLAHLCRHTLHKNWKLSIHPLVREEDYDLRLDLAQIIQRRLGQDRPVGSDAIHEGTVLPKTGK
jgi:hypothetical protein